MPSPHALLLHEDEGGVADNLIGEKGLVGLTRYIIRERAQSCNKETKKCSRNLTPRLSWGIIIPA